MDQTLQSKIDNILEIKNLAPNDETNRLFGELVSYVLKDSREYKKISALEVVELHQRCSIAESELELFWAKKFLESDDSHAEMQKFPYQKNYKKMIEKEISLLEKTGKKINKNSHILLIGSGALPLSSYEFFKQSGAQVDQVDSSQEAIEIGKKITELLGQKSTFFCESGEKVHLEKKYDVVIIAALAGENTRQKQRIISAILPSILDDGKIILRSTKGARSLLYPAVNVRKITDVFLQEVYHPTDEIINSILIYGKKK